MKILVQTAAQNKASALEYYKLLNFNIKELDNSTSLIYDDQFQIIANHNSDARLSIHLIPKDYNSFLDKLSTSKPCNVGSLIQSPSGCLIYIHSDNIDIPKGNSRCLVGNYYGIGLECFDLKASLRFWQSLGFLVKQGSLKTGYISLNMQDCADITLFAMNSCPHQFFNPTITFFNGKVNNPIIIKKLREKEIPISEEITCFNAEGIVDNVIINDPGGLHFFLFNDG